MIKKKLYKESFNKLKNYCENEDFKGWDPYDGLNSQLFQAVPYISKNRFFRLVWIQLFKRSPINLRKITGVKKGYNSKGLGLFLTGYCNLYKTDTRQEYIDKIILISEKLIEIKAKGYSGACWGYNFDWQARAFFQPKGTPTVVATSFIAESLLQAYHITNNKTYLETAISSTEFILKDLNRTYDKEGNYTLSYSPLDKTAVFNAGLLGGKLLTLIYEQTQEKRLLDEAQKIMIFVCNYQQKNGAWAYGTLPFHQWIDNFHTGFNLECLYQYQRVSNDNQFNSNISLGMQYYLKTFFTQEGVSKYYNNKTYPIDIHAPAQLIVTLKKMKILNIHQELADKVLNWTIDNMQSSKGYFYYQKRKRVSSKIPYIRWAQAWMFYAFTFYLLENK